LGAAIDYREFPTPNLNIQATFDPDIPVASVRMTFDNPNRTFCEQKAPYSVFGDSKGDFYNATIPVGSHLATATPYGLSGCRGSPGITVATEFRVDSCTFSFHAYDTAREWNVNRDSCELGSSFSYGDGLPPNTLLSFITSAIPCKVNVEFSAACGFDIRFVRMTLRNAVTNMVVYESKTNGTGPFFLFGTQVVRSNPGVTTYAASNYSIAPGSYTLAAVVNGIQHPPTNILIRNKVPCTECVRGSGCKLCPGKILT
jgi:hypothetical protein